MRQKAGAVAITLIGAFVLAILAGISPVGFLSLENSGNVEASSNELQPPYEVQRGMPQTEADRLQEAKDYVDEAIRRYSADREDALEFYGSEESIDKELGMYLLLLNDGVVVVNPASPRLVNVDIRRITDPKGNEFGKALAEADENGVEVSYVATDTTNPDDNDRFTFRNRTDWAILADGLVFSAGWVDRETDVESTLSKREKAVATVIEARDRMVVLTIPATVEHYKKPESVDGEFYIIMANPRGPIVADATGHLSAGTNIRDIEASDDPELGQKIFALANGGRLWTSHLWPNPAKEGRVERRHTFAVKFSGIYLVSGYYEDTPDVTPPPAPDRLDTAKAYVEEAIEFYRRDSLGAREHYSSTESIDQELGLYLLLIRDGVILVNPVFPDSVNTGIEWRTDPLERQYGKALAEADEEGLVVEYLIPVPSDNFTFRKKTAWAKLDEGKVFSAGWTDRETDVESGLNARQKAIGEVIEARGRLQSRELTPTIAHYRNPESIDGEFYTILAHSNGNIIADATRPDLPVGTNIRDMAASDDPDLGQKIAAVASGEGEWFSHMWPNPATGQEEQRHTYVTRFFSLYIISGYYGDLLPPVVTDECLIEINGAGTYNGTWDDTCLSENRPQDSADGGEAGSDYYARFYTFTLQEASDVTISLSSDDNPPVDTFLYLMEGSGSDGRLVAENDDISSGNRNSRIDEQFLDAGTYTIEATTYEAESKGEFTLVVDVRVTTEPPAPDVTYIAISSGADHVCAIATDGSIMCWGDDSYGQVSERPTSGSFTEISSGDNHTCALRDDGAVICWGSFDVP